MKVNFSKISLKNLAGFISEHLKKHGIDAVLVGGACVSIYTKNKYMSYDLDYISYSEMKEIEKILKEIGFEKKQKYFYKKGCKWFVEFVSPPIAVGAEPVKKFNHIKTPLGEIKLLTPADSAKDRLASFYYWGDKQALKQAVNICKEHNVDVKKIKKWSKDEGQLEKFNLFESHFD